MPHDTIRISLNGFGDFIEAISAAKRKAAVRTFKNKTAGEAKGKSGYYGHAVNAIRRSITQGTPLDAEVPTVTLSCTSPKCSPQQNSVKVASNLRVLFAFSKAFAGASLEPASGKRMTFSPMDEVIITVRPEIVVKVDGVLTLVKIGAKSQPRQPQTVTLMLRIIRDAANSVGLVVDSDHILFLESLSGDLVSTAISTSGLKEEVAELCGPLFATWASIPTLHAG